MSKKSFPKEILVYICDYDEDGNPIFAATPDIGQIPEDVDYEEVGRYTLSSTPIFRVRRELSDIKKGHIG